jgi:hypothetical protein
VKATQGWPCPRPIKSPTWHRAPGPPKVSIKGEGHKNTLTLYFEPSVPDTVTMVGLPGVEGTEVVA